jgi:uncharacterized DUF497 family protein
VKRQANLRKRGLDFADLEAGFDWEDMLLVPAHPGRDGRARLMAVAMMGGQLMTVIFARLGTEAISIITMRHASRKERRSYDGR